MIPICDLIGCPYPTSSPEIYLSTDLSEVSHLRSPLPVIEAAYLTFSES